MSRPVYCGSKKPPKGRRVGTYQECQARKQIRLYGLYPIEVLVPVNAKASTKSKSSKLPFKSVILKPPKPPKSPRSPRSRKTTQNRFSPGLDFPPLRSTRQQGVRRSTRLALKR